MSVTRYEIINQVGVIKINNPPVNALSHGAREGLFNTIAAAQDDASKAIMIIGEGKTFSAGADITEMDEPRLKPLLPEVQACIEQSAKTIKKVPVLAGACYGFIGNRMLRLYACEAQLCLIEGASPEQVDSVMQNLGMAMGPLAVGDLAGLDIGYQARQALSSEQSGHQRPCWKNSRKQVDYSATGVSKDAAT